MSSISNGVHIETTSETRLSSSYFSRDGAWPEITPLKTHMSMLPYPKAAFAPWPPPSDHGEFRPKSFMGIIYMQLTIAVNPQNVYQVGHNGEIIR